MKNKRWLLGLGILGLVACGVENEEESRVSQVVCVRTEVGETVQITCNDVTIVGTKGDKGDNGINGQDGVDGINGIDGKDGKDGIDGIDGIDGQDGVDGIDGIDGVDGKDAILEIIDPCGPILDAPLWANEILIRLTTGELMVYFEDGGKRYLSLIGPGYYRTTDAQQCYFTVTPDLQVTW